MVHSSIYNLAVPYPFNNHVATFNGVHGAPVSLARAECTRSPNQRLDADLWRVWVLRDTLQPAEQALRNSARHGGRFGDAWREIQRHDAYSPSASKMSSVGNAGSIRPDPTSRRQQSS
jgi:hypothetical protein